MGKKWGPAVKYAEYNQNYDYSSSDAYGNYKAVHYEYPQKVYAKPRPFAKFSKTRLLFKNNITKNNTSNPDEKMVKTVEMEDTVSEQMNECSESQNKTENSTKKKSKRIKGKNANTIENLTETDVIINDDSLTAGKIKEDKKSKKKRRKVASNTTETLEEAVASSASDNFEAKEVNINNGKSKKKRRKSKTDVTNDAEEPVSNPNNASHKAEVLVMINDEDTATKKKHRKHKRMQEENDDDEPDTISKKKKKKSKKNKDPVMIDTVIATPTPQKVKKNKQKVNGKPETEETVSHEPVSGNKTCRETENLVNDNENKMGKKKKKKSKVSAENTIPLNQEKLSCADMPKTMDTSQELERKSQPDKPLNLKKKKKNKSGKDASSTEINESGGKQGKAAKKRNASCTHDETTDMEALSPKKKRKSSQKDNGSNETMTQSSNSAGQWSEVSLGDDSRTNKFLRLMGARSNSKDNTFSKKPCAIRALTANDAEKLNSGLEEQFMKANNEFFSNGRGVGLGFEKPPGEGKKFFIDTNSSKSKKFDD